jgi:hypothetical protein
MREVMGGERGMNRCRAVGGEHGRDVRGGDGGDVGDEECRRRRGASCLPCAQVRRGERGRSRAGRTASGVGEERDSRTAGRL